MEDERNMTPHPHLQALLVCDLVIKEAGTNKHSVIGVFNRLASTVFPTQHRTMSLYFAFSDAQGRYQPRIELSELGEERLIWALDLPHFQVKDRLDQNDLGVTIQRLSFPNPGTYEFRILLNGMLLGGKRLVVQKIEARSQPPR